MVIKINKNVIPIIIGSDRRSESKKVKIDRIRSCQSAILSDAK